MRGQRHHCRESVLWCQTTENRESERERVSVLPLGECKMGQSLRIRTVEDRLACFSSKIKKSTAREGERERNGVRGYGDDDDFDDY